MLAWGGSDEDEELVPIRSSRDAEHNAAVTLRRLGFKDVHLTGLGADGGVDIRGREVLGQVKAEVLPVGLAVVQRLWGCAAKEHLDGAVFALAGYTASALAWAEDVHGLALFRFDLLGHPEPVNDVAGAWVSRSRLRLFHPLLPEALGGSEWPATWQELEAACVTAGRLLADVQRQHHELRHACYEARLNRRPLVHCLLPRTDTPVLEEALVRVITRDIGTAATIMPPDANRAELIAARGLMRTYDVLYLPDLTGRLEGPDGSAIRDEVLELLIAEPDVTVIATAQSLPEDLRRLFPKHGDR